jgi:hypothetical protein
MITVTLRGSFGPLNGTTEFSAMEGGHALAITRAIQSLTDAMPRAIQMDHKLASEGQKPPTSDFGILPMPSKIA